MSSTSTRELYLIKSKVSSTSRGHFSIFVPSIVDAARGTRIHVVGAPMIGYKLEFQRGHRPEEDRMLKETVLLGRVREEHVANDTDVDGEDDVPRNNLQKVALACPPPRASKNFLAPTNDVDNRRCQEWTMEYIKCLVQKGYIDASAIEVAQSKRDPPDFGIGLTSVGEPSGGKQSASNKGL